MDVITFIESAKSNPFFHVLPIGLALFSINGRFIYCNRAYLDMFDLPEDVAGRHVSDYFLTGYRGVMECLRAREMMICPSVTNTSRLGGRSHDALDKLQIGKCPECGEPRMPHQLCSGCGKYKGKQIVYFQEEQ